MTEMQNEGKILEWGGTVVALPKLYTELKGDMALCCLVWFFL